MTPALDAENLVQIAVRALDGRSDGDPSPLDDMPVAIYATDREGVITWYNKACIDFAGRTPVTHRDRWCVSWKLLSDDGGPMPHDRCPMAVAVRQRCWVRGLTGVAEGPDGRRVAFRAYPTPLFDDEGEFIGAVNVLEDITVVRDQLLARARRCRRLARGINDSEAAAALEHMAAECEGAALELARAG